MLMAEGPEVGPVEPALRVLRYREDVVDVGCWSLAHAPAAHRVDFEECSAQLTPLLVVASLLSAWSKLIEEPLAVLLLLRSVSAKRWSMDRRSVWHLDLLQTHFSVRKLSNVPGCCQ